jgi:thymidylate kinase
VILTLEGPDCSGKTTLFKQLSRILSTQWCKLQSLPLHPDLFPHMLHVEERQLALWENLYVGQRILCDRHVCVSGHVYGELYGRQPLRRSHIEHRMRVVHLVPPLPILQDRFAARGDEKQTIEDLPRLVELYDKHTRGFNCLQLNTARPMQECIMEIMRWLK